MKFYMAGNHKIFAINFILDFHVEEFQHSIKVAAEIWTNNSAIRNVLETGN